MTRRSWLAVLLSILGVGPTSAACRPAAAADPSATSPFPYLTYRVTGEAALSARTKLMAAGEGYPVIVGPPETADLVSEAASLDQRSVAEVLAAADTVRFPRDLLLRHAEERRVEAAEVGETYDDASQVGTWPALTNAETGGFLTRDLLSRTPHPEVLIVVLPTRDPAEALAVLRFGGWNACPLIETHVAALRSWRDRFGFELVGVGPDIIEGRVARRPADRAAALALAREMWAYSPDIVDQGTVDLATLAATLMVSDDWFFWWD
ncbi:MAG: DUF4253 domain-containing protein [Brevundimonas sp.]